MRTLAAFLALSFCTALVAGCAQESAPVANSSGERQLASDARTAQVAPLQLGDPPRAFTVEDVTGPSSGEALCYRCKYAGKPTVVIFARELNDSVSSLVQEIDKKVAENADKKLSAFMVLVGDNTDEAKPQLQRLATAQNIQNTPLTVFNNAEGPSGYGLSPQAKIQVMMWNNSGLKVNRPVSDNLSREEVAELVGQTQTILN